MARELRGRGLVYIDCPVTGLPQAAAAGKLTLLVGAEPADLDRAKPYLAPIGDVVRHFGAVGTGTVFKLINNLMGAVQIASLAEGVAMAEQAGLDMNLVAEALATGAVASPQVIRHSKRMVARDFSGASFTSALRHKDAALRGETGREPAGRRRRWSDAPRSRPMPRRRPNARRRRRQDDRDRLAAEIAAASPYPEIGWESPARRNKSAESQI